MELILKADWEPMQFGGSKLAIAGLKAFVFDRGDVWAWEVCKESRWEPGPLGENWCDRKDPDEDPEDKEGERNAQKEAEAFIRSYFNKEGQR